MNNATTLSNDTGARREDCGVSQAVVEAVADAEGVAPWDLDQPLYAVVDPDALDELVASMGRWPDAPTGQVTFTYSGYEVGVSADGTVSVDRDAADSR